MSSAQMLKLTRYCCNMFRYARRIRVLLCVAAVSPFLWLYWSKRNHNAAENPLKEALKNAENQIDILIWYPPLGDNVTKQISPKHKSTCGICESTYDRSKINEDRTKAVVFHFGELSLDTMPKKRRTDQYYIWWAMESPSVLKNAQKSHEWALHNFDRIFNLTMTYRRDSDVLSSYGWLAGLHKRVRRDEDLSDPKTLDNFRKRKTKVAAWIVSNCNYTEGAKTRMALSDKLIEFGLKLDRFGGCFPDKHFEENGLKATVQQYKFYMAFENVRYCRDYITEKFFETSLGYGSVPVVWGAKKEDYDAVAPPNSYIYAEDFTEQGLVEYLQYLDKNDTAYMEYFKWRTIPLHELPAMDQQIKFCQICRILHGINVDNLYNSKYEEKYKWIPLSDFPNKPRIVPSIQNWLHDGEYDECLST